jgi:transposase
MKHFIGCDVHTRDQVVAWIEEETGEIKKRRLEHGGEEVRKFYAQFPRGTVVGIEATFPAYWFEQLLGELGHELWVGDAARIRASEVRQQKTDARDAELMLDLLRTNRFPRIWVPSPEERDLRQLLVHRMKQVRARTQVKNQLHALAISQGVCRGRKLWSAQGRKELESLALLPWAARRRKELLETLDRLDEQVRELDRAGASGGGTAAHPSGSGKGGVPGLRADGGTGRAFPQQPQAGELLGPEPARELLGWPAAPGLD